MPTYTLCKFPMAMAVSVQNPSLVINPRSYTRRHKLKMPTTSNVVPRRPLPSASRPVIASKKTDPSPDLASIWREIQGSGDWRDLVDPLNPLLRSEIIRYGEFVAACYKAYDIDPRSKRHLNCRYGKKSMLASVGMNGSGYQVTKYIYATPDIAIPMQPGTCSSRWIGYVAVSSDQEVARLGRRDVLVAFRGTVTGTEWIANMMSSLTPARLDPHDPRTDVRVESGFLSLYTSDDSTCRFSQGSCREQLLGELSRIISKHKAEEVSITLAGHSMGSSLALLLGYDLAELGISGGGTPITVYSFGGPRVGNGEFKKRCEELGVKVLRVANVNDPVTKLPGVVLNENFRVLAGKYEMPWSCSCYAHVGVELALDFFKMGNPTCVHDLGAYIGVLKCPRVAQAQQRGADLVGKFKEALRQKKIDAWHWKHAARRVGDVVQSLGF